VKKERGKFDLKNVGRSAYVFLFCREYVPVLNSHIFILVGIPNDPTEAILMEESTCKIGKNSKIVYINDSYNLDTINFDVDQIIDTDKIVNID
jgi:hypothetical protein